MPPILIIEEDLPIQRFFRELLERAGYTVSVATSKVEGLWSFQHEKPVLVMASVHVRRGIGWDLVEDLRQREPDVPLVVLASAASPKAEETAAGLGCAGYISKEAPMRDLEKALLAMVRRILPEPSPGAVPSKGRVLVVDDDEQILSLLKRFLERKGYEVRTAPNGVDGLAMVKVHRPHVMLLDLNMPVMNGMEVLQRLRDIDKEVAVMVITGTGDEGLGREALQKGAMDYISKPLDLKYLETTLMVKLLLMTS